VSGCAGGIRERSRAPAGTRALVAWIDCGVSTRPDDIDNAGDRRTRRSPALCRRTHIVVDGMDGRRARIRRARGTGSSGRAPMIIALLILHGLLAVALLGALTHQAFAVAAVKSDKKRSFFP